MMNVEWCSDQFGIDREVGNSLCLGNPEYFVFLSADFRGVKQREKSLERWTRVKSQGLDMLCEAKESGLYEATRSHRSILSWKVPWAGLQYSGGQHRVQVGERRHWRSETRDDIKWDLCICGWWEIQAFEVKQWIERKDSDWEVKYIGLEMDWMYQVKRKRPWRSH